MPHCPPALISSSASTTSSAPKCRASPGAWCPTALQPLFLRRGAPRPPPQNADRPRGRGASLPSSPYFFVEAHHVFRFKVPGSPGDVVPHCPPALISSSRRTTSSTPKCRASPGAWCLIPRYPLFLRPQAPRPPLQSAGQPRGRGVSLSSRPYFFVGKHHVQLLSVPTDPGTWCLTVLQPLFLRRGAPRPPLQSAGHPRGRGASLPSSPYFFVLRHHVLRSEVPGSPGGVVPHSPQSLVPSSAGTTSGGSNTQPSCACVRMLQNLDFSR